MFVFVLALLLLFTPAHVIAEDPTLTPTETPTVTETPTETPTPFPTETPTSAPEPTATTAPTSAPNNSSSNNAAPTSTPKPSLKPSTSQIPKSGGFGGGGLVDETDSGSTGLANGNSLGAATSQDLPSDGDGDLLKTLIFLTGAVVLVVWTTYTVLVQKGVIKSGKKNEKQPAGITPQPID